ncbi:hypothetical protein [Nocardioides sp. Soil805]|uniref:hypothetical protein n=1 Tax=Nocardioides sp. Soil805 TaxID=1736416 RepID=UPI000703AA06|nr:hypothetical protein [Nocardioides sp. Soil805]KRF36873.1 hypothetical protein ASG94_05600 [Nocardioides sp. Soil805]
MAQPGHRSLRRALLLLVSTALSAALASALCVAPSQAADRIPREFFGMDVAITSQGETSWPALDVGAVRVALSWRSVEQSIGAYTWNDLDAKVATAESHDAQPLLVLEGTPGFHATGKAPHYGSAPRLKAYRSFVRALVARYGDRADYQVWNEGNVPIFFDGTPANLAAMSRVLGRATRDLAPSAQVLAPSFVIRGSGTLREVYRAYWSQKIGRFSVGRFVDAAAISAYPMEPEDPEDALVLTQWAQRVLDKKGFQGPLWASEINYGASGLQPTIAPIPMRRQVAYVVRTYALHASAGADRVYWWRWLPHITVNTTLNNGKGGLTRAGKAYRSVEDWLVGTRPTGCKVAKGVRTCGFRLDKQTTRYVSWTRSGQTRVVVAPAGSRTKTKPSGATSRVRRGDRVRVGLTPVMIETRSRRDSRSR